MSETHLAGPDHFATSPEEPIVLVGTPGILRTRVPMRNPTGERLRLREAVLRGGIERVLGASAQPPLSDMVLFAGQDRLATLTVAVDPYAPPGEYAGELEVAGHVRPFVLTVLEKVDLRISPTPVVVQNLPGETLTKQVVLENRGNVPLTIAEIGPIALDDELFECHALRATAKVVDENDKNLQKILAEILIQGGKIIEEMGLLRIRNQEVVMEPGDIVTLSLEVRVPDKISPRGRYTAVAPLYTTDIELLIVPGGAKSKPPATPAAATPPKRASAKAATNPAVRRNPRAS